MQTNRTLKQRLIILALALALAVAVPLGLRWSSRPARVAAQPLAVAVNWNSFAETALEWSQG